MFHDVAKKLPVFLPATVTLGIAPLLFLQVLYGQFFYTSSIVMAWPWFLVLVFVTLAYYGFYYVSYRGGRPSARAGVVLLFSMILIFLIGFLFSNNPTSARFPRVGPESISRTPRLEGQPDQADADSPLSALPPGGRGSGRAAPGIPGRGQLETGPGIRPPAPAVWRKGLHVRHMAQFVVGITFLFSLPRDLRMLFMGDNLWATILLLIGVAGGIGAIMLMSAALRRENVRAAAFYVPGVLVVVIASMSLMRDILRDAI